eukprot:360127-Chlamydomonas_euryale.AAC.2
MDGRHGPFAAAGALGIKMLVASQSPVRARYHKDPSQGCIRARRYKDPSHGCIRAVSQRSISGLHQSSATKIHLRVASEQCHKDPSQGCIRAVPQRWCNNAQKTAKRCHVCCHEGSMGRVGEALHHGERGGRGTAPWGGAARHCTRHSTLTALITNDAQH